MGWCEMTRTWLFNGISFRFTTLRTMQCKGISVAKFITVGHWSYYPACLAGLNHLGPNTQGAYMSYIHLTLFVGFRTVQRKFISGIFCTLHKFQHSAGSPFHFAFRWQYERDWSSRKTQSHPSFPKEVGEWQLCKSKVQGDPFHRLGIHGCRRRNAACGLNFNHWKSGNMVNPPKKEDVYDFLFVNFYDSWVCSWDCSPSVFPCD